MISISICHCSRRVCSIFRLTPIGRCGHATWPQHLTFLLFPDLRVDVKVTLLGRGRSIVASALFPGDKVLSLETSFSCCWVYLRVCWLAGWQVEEPWQPCIFLWSKCQRRLRDIDLPALKIPDVFWGKGGDRYQHEGFGVCLVGVFFFLFFLNNLSFSQCCQEGLYWPLPLIPSPAEYCVPLLQ